MSKDTHFEQDPEDDLDYTFDFSDWMATGDEISTATVDVQTGLTKGVVSNTSDTVTVWLSNGVRAAKHYKVTCEIVTTGSRKVQRSIWVRVVDL